MDKFSAQPKELYGLIKEAEFEYLNSFYIEAELNRCLYYYGMYQYFYQDYTANEARELSLDFMNNLFENDLENVVAFHTLRAWGRWFDIHSCSDSTFVVLNKRARLIWLFCFSHSD